MESLQFHGQKQKRVSISSKRQITIPQSYFNALGFDKEAICMIEDGKLVLIPADRISGGEFAEYILADLIKEGYSGQELLREFHDKQMKIRPAVEKILKAAKEAAYNNGDFESYEDVFGTEEES